MKVIAHRGFSGIYPENTMLAFIKGNEAGCDGIELDVHLTKDHELVIIHDESIDRTTDGTGLVRDYTYEELSKFNASELSKETHGFNKIPSLDEYFLWVKETNIITNIEIKNNIFYYEEIEEKLVEMVKKYQLEDRIIFSSFNPLSIVKCKEIAPEIECGLLIEQNIIENPGYLLSRFGIEYYHPPILGLTEDIVKNCNDYGIKLNVWTVNDSRGLYNLYNWKCNSIITDFPDVSKTWLENQ